MADDALHPAPHPVPDPALHQALAQVRRYHQRSKHQLGRYAAGPDTLDWDAQPQPFRRWWGCELWPLPLSGTAGAAPLPTVAWADWASPRPAAPFDRAHLGLLLELSLALAAWKESGPDRWAVRINPSSGNLHPTEAWLLRQGADPSWPEGLYHYAPYEHALELRAAWAPQALADGAAPTPGGAEPGVWLALSSIAWREAWKYGERAFRYCQLDAGHASAALRVAAGLLGWRLVPVAVPLAELARRLGLDRAADLAGGAEPEDAEALFELQASLSPTRPGRLPPQPAASWSGQASRLDPHPMYRWPVVAEVAAASALGTPPAPVPAAHRTTAITATAAAMPTGATPDDAVRIIRQRRSAQRFDARARLPAATLWPLLAALHPERPPCDALCSAPAVQVLLFAHRVEGLAPGAYLLPRGPGALQRLRAALPADLAWAEVPQAPAALGLWQLADNPALAGTLRTLNCHQALGSDAMLAFALLGHWDDWHDADGQPQPRRYRQGLQEAGLIGQMLYLHAEAAGLAGTGIGCFFDDSLHQLLGLDRSPAGLHADSAALQSLYHFTIGLPVPDSRIRSHPPYAHLNAASTP